MGWVERSEDRFELRVVRLDDDIPRIEAEPLPPACLEPIRAFRADQHDHSAARGGPFELMDGARIRWNAGARHRQISPRVDDRECIEESSAYVSTRASACKNASQPGRGFNANELGRLRAEVHGEPAASCGHLEHPPSLDLEPREDAGMDGFSLADGVPELRLELIHQRPEQSPTEPMGRFSVAARGRFAFSCGDCSQVVDWQPIDIMEAVPLPAGRSCRSSLEVIHVYFDLNIWR
jgi:hypothetical protein